MLFRNDPRINLEKRRGAAVVEFAAVAPVLFLIILGLFELSRALMVREMLTHAARKACRRAILGTYTNAQITGEVTSTLAAIGVQGETATVVINDQLGQQLSPSTPPQTEITVRVTVPVSAVSWVPFLRYLKNNLYSEYTMRKE
jgi:Flp pilus assembly protein TadG